SSFLSFFSLMKVSFSLISASRFCLILLFEGISKEKVAVFRSSREIKTSVSLFFNYKITLKI
ncbi:hypothetical protein, partial [Enterococcus sp. 2CBP]|uniref:hypothetical protein n=1 Tax=Enterococcus sp. 2CBP TaxID=2800793 RepID=UPI002905CCC1